MSRNNTYFFIRENWKYERIAVADILYIESKANYVHIRAVNRTIILHNTMVQMIGALPEELFCRVHHSYAVAVDHVLSFDRHHAYLQGDVKVPIGAQYRGCLEKKVWILQKDESLKKKKIKNGRVLA